MVSCTIHQYLSKTEIFSSSYQTPFKCIGPILTTWRIFSLFKIPSRRPRVIPATFNNFVPLIIWLSGIHKFKLQWSKFRDPYRHVERHKRPWLRLGSTYSLHLPTKLQLPEASSREALLDQWYHSYDTAVEEELQAHQHNHAVEAQWQALLFSVSQTIC